MDSDLRCPARNLLVRRRHVHVHNVNVELKLVDVLLHRYPLLVQLLP